jgi:hypothetical protein
MLSRVYQRLTKAVVAIASHTTSRTLNDTLRDTPSNMRIYTPRSRMIALTLVHDRVTSRQQSNIRGTNLSHTLRLNLLMGAYGRPQHMRLSLRGNQRIVPGLQGTQPSYSLIPNNNTPSKTTRVLSLVQ